MLCLETVEKQIIVKCNKRSFSVLVLIKVLNKTVSVLQIWWKFVLGELRSSFSVYV